MLAITMTSTSATDQVVHVVDDDDAIRRSLGRLITGAGYGFAGHATAEAFQFAWRHGMRGCAIVDLQLPGVDGLNLQSRLAKEGDGPEIVFLSGTADIDKSVAAMKAGAVDFLTKPVGKTRLLEAIHAALQRDSEKRQERAAILDLDIMLARLTRRETEVLERIVAGLLNKQIAADLGLSLATVKVHRGRIMQKLGVRTAAQLVSLVVAHQATRQGYVAE